MHFSMEFHCFTADVTIEYWEKRIQVCFSALSVWFLVVVTLIFQHCSF